MEKLIALHLINETKIKVPRRIEYGIFFSTMSAGVGIPIAVLGYFIPIVPFQYIGFSIFILGIIFTFIIGNKYHTYINTKRRALLDTFEKTGELPF